MSSSDDDVGRSQLITKPSRAKAGVAKNTGVTSGKKRARDGSIKSNGLKPVQNVPGLRSRHENGARITKDDTQRSEVAVTKGQGSLKDKAAKLLDQRRKLPIWQHQEKICKSLKGPEKNVLLLVGETGSGKSTQVPQFLTSEPWATKGMIAITQPRRVAAISLARRVADEMGTPLGNASPASKVGYSVRFDQSVSPSTRIKFLTEGMLLQEMLRDPTLKQYSAVVVDEVHERSVNVDLILGFLKNLLGPDKAKRKGQPLKVVVMSATADVEALTRFFSGSKTSVAEADEKSNDISKNSGEVTASKANLVNGSKQPSLGLSSLYIEGRQYPVTVSHLPTATSDFVEESLKTVFKIHTTQPLPGDILVFLTGQDTVESLERLINEYGANMDLALPKILALPLFAALPQAAQQKVFQPAPPRTRKVIISTNIAETSVTVPGVRHVIDSGKQKMKKYRANLGLESLLVEPVSKSSAIQRQGRAGREAAGFCHRLYTAEAFAELDPTTVPEILRCDLSSALLTMKARGINDVLNFPLLSPPPRAALEKALLQLFQLGCLRPDGLISAIGKQVAGMPLSPPLGRVLIEASQPEKDCVAEVIDIIACLSVETIFLNVVTEERKEAAEEARKELLRREGDHLTLLATVRRYANENVDRKAWCEKYFVSHRAMQNVMDIRKQLQAQARSLKLLDIPTATNSAADEDLTAPYSEALSAAILQSLLAGFAHNTARLMPDGTYRTLVSNQQVAIHPSSVLFGRKVEAIIFTEWVWTTKSFGRGISAVQLGWVEEALTSGNADEE